MSVNEFPIAVWKIGNIGRRIEKEISGKWCALFIKGLVQFSFVQGVSVHKVICWLMFYRENDYWFWCYRCGRGKLPKLAFLYNWITLSSLDKTLLSVCVDILRYTKASSLWYVRIFCLCESNNTEKQLLLFEVSKLCMYNKIKNYPQSGSRVVPSRQCHVNNLWWTCWQWCRHFDSNFCLFQSTQNLGAMYNLTKTVPNSEINYFLRVSSINIPDRKF